MKISVGAIKRRPAGTCGKFTSCRHIHSLPVPHNPSGLLVEGQPWHQI